jgi:VCBS repeat-containing protein
MKVSTPVATMGIRGTAVILDINAIDGTVSVSVVNQRDGQIHAVQVFNARGDLIGTVTSNGSSLTLRPTATFEVIAQESGKTLAQVLTEFNAFQQLLSTYEIGKQLIPNTPAPTDGRRGDNTQQPLTKFAGSTISPIDSTTTKFNADIASTKDAKIDAGTGDAATLRPTGDGTGLATKVAVNVGDAPTQFVDVPATSIPFVVTPSPVSRISSGPGDHFGPVMSADGQFVTYDPDGAIYLFDRQTGATRTIASPGEGFTYGSPTISSDGHFVVYQGSDGTQSWIFIYSNDASDPAHYGQTIRLMSGGQPAISGDGSKLVVERGGSIGLYDQQGHELANITGSAVGITGTLWKPAISADGHIIAFWSSDLSSPGGAGQLFTYDLSTATARSIASTATDAGNSAASFSADGHYVVYQSDAPGGHSEIYLYDLRAGEVVFHTANPDPSYNPVLSPDGHFIILASDARLTADDRNTVTDIYVINVTDPSHPAYKLVSVLDDGTQGDDASNLGAAISAGGQFIAFGSRASNFSSGDGPGTGDIFVVDPTSGHSAIILESRNSPTVLGTSGVIKLTGEHSGITLGVSDSRLTASFDSHGDIQWSFSEPRSDFASLQPGQISVLNFVITLRTDRSTTEIPVKVSIYDVDQPVVSVADAAPVASPVTLASGTEDSSYTITSAALLAGVVDIDGPSLSITAVGILSGGGGIVDNHNGSFRYTPAPNYNGPVVFNYTASDGTLSASSIATLDVAGVNDAPVVTKAAFAVSEGGTVVLGAANIGVTDPDDASAAFTVSNVTHGKFEITTNGSVWVEATTFTTADLAAGHVRFVHDGGEAAPTFSIQADDGEPLNHLSATVAGTVQFINVNDTPTVSSAVTGGGAEGSGVATVNLLNFASDADAGAVLHVKNLVWTETGSGFPAGVTLGADGNSLLVDTNNLAYDHLAQGASFAAHFSYDVVDENGALVHQTATVTIAGTNDAPVILRTAGLLGIGFTASTQQFFIAAMDPGSAAVTTLNNFAFDSGSWVASTLTASHSDLYVISGAGPTVNGSLYDFDAATGVLKSVVAAGAQFEALRSESSGTLIGIGYDFSIGKNFIATIDPHSGAVTTLSNFTFDSLYWGSSSLTVSGNDLYALSAPMPGGHGSLYDFNATTGALKSVVSLSVEFQGLRAGPNGKLIGIGQNFIATVDPVTGAVVTLNHFAFDTGAWIDSSLTVVGNDVYALSSGPAGNGSLYDFDATTGALKSFVPAGAQFDDLVAGGHRSGAVSTARMEGSGTSSVNLLQNAFDVDDGAVLHVANLVRTDMGGGMPAGFALSPDGNSITVDTDSPDYNTLAQGETFTVHFSYDVVDEHGASVHQTAAVTIAGVNDAPTITAAALRVVEGGTAVLSAGSIGVTDPDNTSFTFTVSNVSHGRFETTTNGTNWAAATTFTTAGLNAGHVRFVHDGGEHAPTFSIRTDDGAGSNRLSNVLAGSVTFTNVNDAPEVTVPAAHYQATEQTNLSLRNTGLSVSDADGNGGTETVTLAVGEGILTIAAGDSGVSNISGNGTGSVTFSGSTAQINALLNSSTGSIVYNDDTDTPGTSTKLTLTVHDNGNSGEGGDQVGIASSTIDITAVDDAPVIQDGDSRSLSVAENTTAVETLVADDPDGPSLTYSIVTGSGSPDASKFTIDSTTGALSFVNAPDFGNPTDSNHNNIYTVQVRASDGTLSDTQTLLVHVADVNDNAPVITTNSSQSVVEKHTFVMHLSAFDVDIIGGPTVFSIADGSDGSLFEIVNGNLQFKAAPDFEHPSDANHNNIYSVTVNASDGLNSSAKTFSVQVTNVNEAPVLVPNTSDVTYVENGTPRALMSAGSVTDPDNPSNFDDGSISVTLNGAVSGDELVLATGSHVSISGSSVRVDGATVGTISGNHSMHLTVEFNSNATDSRVETVLHALSFDSTSDTPTNADRTATVTFNDGSNDGSGPALSDSSTVTIHVTPVNDAPHAANDIVITNNANDSTYKIPDWALLANDTDPDGTALNLTAITASSEFASIDLTTNPGNVTIHDLLVGGSFTYRASDGSLSDTANVTVAQDTGTMNGGSGNEIFIGDSNGTTINANGGNDILIGNAGNDTLNGGSGNDTYVFGLHDGHDVINDTSGLDTIRIEAGGAAVSGLSFAENTTHDLVIQFSGQQVTVDDHFTGDDNVGGLQFDGGASYDGYSLGSDLYFLSNDGGSSRDGTSGNDVLSGDGNANSLSGGDGNDLLFGNAGHDTLNGGSGKDLLVGGSGNDTMTGGSGNDQFVFATGFGKDIIIDFESGHDKIDLFAVVSTNDVDGWIHDRVTASPINAADTLITIDASDTITLRNVLAASLHASDFIVHPVT